MTSTTSSSWQQREQDAVAKLLEALPQWTGPLDEDAPLPKGTKTQTGTLAESGLTYYWRRNNEPQDRVELVIAVRAGSIDETDEERGLAHVLEHLAFRARTGEDGTRWAAMRELEAHGVSFGAHQNAYTSFEETVFFLHVPSDFFGRALELLAALVGEAAKVDASDVDAERKIVLEEWRQGKDWGQRSTEHHFRHTFEGTTLAARLPIGDLEVVRTARPETIQRFYERHYRGDALAIIVVGAVPEAVQREQVDRAFAPYFRKGAAPRWPRAPATFFPDEDAFGATVFSETPKRRVRASVFEDTEATSAFAAISVAKRYEAAATIGGFKRWLVADVAQNVVNRELGKLAMASDPPFASASIGTQPPMALRRSDQGIRGVSVSMLSAVPLAHDRVAESLRSAWRAVCQKRDNVTEDELRMARREILGDLQTQWKERDQTESSPLANEARDHFLLAAPYVDDRDEVALAAALVQTITVQEVRQAITRMFPDAGLDAVVAVTRPAPGFRWPWAAPVIPAAALEAELVTLLDDVSGGAQAATEAFDADAFFTPPSGVRAPVTSRRLPLPNGLEALELALGNGGTVTFVRTDFKDDEVVLFGCAAGGLSQLCGRDTNSKLAMSARGGASLAGRYGAVGAPRAALGDALGGRRVALGADIDAYRRIVSGDCTADEVETLFGLLARLFANAPHRSEAQAKTYVNASRDAVRERKRDPGARFGSKRDELVTQDHPFWRHWTNRDLDEFDPHTASDFFDAGYASPDGFHIAVVGSLPDDETLAALVQSYLAPLPSRASVSAAHPRAEEFGFAKDDAPIKAEACRPLGASFPSQGLEAVVRASTGLGETDDDQQLARAQSRWSWPVRIGAATGRTDDERAEERLAESVRVDVAARCLQVQLTEALRFDAADVYSVSAYVDYHTADPLVDAVRPLDGILDVSCGHQPERHAAVNHMVRTALEAAAKTGPKKRDLDSVLEALANDRAERLRTNNHWAATVSSTYLSPRYRGDVGATVAETFRVNERVRAALAGPEGVAAVGATLTRALPTSLDRCVRVRLAPPPPFFRSRAVLVAAAAAAVAAVAVVRSRRTAV